ncbi:hypothetical protein CR513_01222, partial [Mucuna pruriens]
MAEKLEECWTWSKKHQSINAKVEALSRGRKERSKVASLHESEGSFDEGHYSERSDSSRTSRGGRHERQERLKRYGRDERRERHGRRKDEPGREKLDLGKCKILPFLGNCKSEVYVDYELKVEQMLSCFDMHGRMIVRLVTLNFGDYALV